MLRKKVFSLILVVGVAATFNFVPTNFVHAISVQKEYINYNRSHEKLQPIGIIIHDTDDPGGTAQNNRDYFNSSYVASSAHYFVDWNKAIQAVPENEVAWHAGPTANHKYLSVEMCVPYGNNQDKFNKVYQNTIQLVASICKRYGWNSSNIYSHDWVSKMFHETNHTDPIGYLHDYGKSWDQLVGDIQKAINGQAPNDNIPGNQGQAGDASIGELQTALNNGGYGHISINNIADATTIAACPLLTVNSKGDIVKWLQKKLGISADGIFGNATKQAVANFQKANGLDNDGVVGKMTWSKLLSSNVSNNGNTSNTTNNQPVQVSSGSIAELKLALNNGGYGHLTVNNTVDTATLQACPLLKVNSQGDLVKWLQKKLGIGADGIFGNGTKRAVADFQKSNGLDNDGVVGKMTWRKLLGL
ncbi:peptidoglycan recognition protein family protein [Clostridium hydrogenum]|uniref:peptidoglycan recognition protein family protein n=1 Tax=Clostridium hydrogenum TaxID=2855764 RepID=UPI001F37752D|nr:N-acetylmuramoyl-L-alanine amidase [Clostridium hydrogenum]